MQISFRVTSDLLLANSLAPETSQILFHNVLSFTKNVSSSCDITEFAQLLEDESQGNIDSDKLLSIDQLKKLRSALIVFYKASEKLTTGMSYNTSFKFYYFHSPKALIY